MEEGGVVIMPGGPPSNISGYNNQDKKTLSDLVAKVAAAPEIDGIKNIELGKGKIFVGNDLNNLLMHAGIRYESMVGAGIQFLRKKFPIIKHFILLLMERCLMKVGFHCKFKDRQHQFITP